MTMMIHHTKGEENTRIDTTTVMMKGKGMTKNHEEPKTQKSFGEKTQNLMHP